MSKLNTADTLFTLTYYFLPFRTQSLTKTHYSLPQKILLNGPKFAANTILLLDSLSCDTGARSGSAKAREYFRARIGDKLLDFVERNKEIFSEKAFPYGAKSILAWLSRGGTTPTSACRAHRRLIARCRGNGFFAV